MSRSKKQRRNQQISNPGSSLKEELESVERTLKGFGDLWIKIEDYQIQKEFISKKQKMYDSFESLKKKVFLLVGEKHESS